MGSCMSHDNFIMSSHVHTRSHTHAHTMLLSCCWRPQNPASRSSSAPLRFTPSCGGRQPETGIGRHLCGHFSHLENQYSVVCLIALLLLNESLWRENSKCIVKLMGENSGQMTWFAFETLSRRYYEKSESRAGPSPRKQLVVV